MELECATTSHPSFEGDAFAVGSINASGASLEIHFSGFDDYPYAVETTANLVDWMLVSTNYPTNGSFRFSVPATISQTPRFYRSVLLP